MAAVRYLHLGKTGCLSAPLQPANPTILAGPPVSRPGYGQPNDCQQTLRNTQAYLSVKQEQLVQGFGHIWEQRGRQAEDGRLDQGRDQGLTLGRQQCAHYAPALCKVTRILDANEKN